MSDDSRKSRVTILQTSDLHGTILPIQYANNELMEAGLAKIATLIRRERALHANVLFVDNGDLIQGTPLSYYHARIDNEPADPCVIALNELQADAAVLGNHEFNYGMEVLTKAVSESRFPWLSANIVDSASGEPLFGKPYIVRTFGDGIRLALLGLTTPYIPNWENPLHIAGLEFRDAVDTAKEWVPYIKREEKADIVVVAYHGGFERGLETGEPTEPQTGENQGYRLCMEVEGIDVLLTGHQHRAIAGASINGVTVVQPSNQGRYAGKVDIVLELGESGWHIVGKTSQLLSVDGVEADSAIVGLVSEYEAKTQLWLDQPIGRAIGDMTVADPMEVRTRDTALIEFINKVQMETAGTELANTALFDNTSPGFKPEITMRDVVSNYIYPNTLKVIRVTGQDIRDALELSAQYFDTYSGDGYRVSPAFSEPKPQHYNYDMWEGIEYELNVSRPPGERVTVLRYRGEPIDLRAEFDVAMNNYRAGGGGYYTMFQGKPVVRDIPTDISELIANYILERGTIEATVNGNWRVVHD
ncbi:bifunctional metallophosphatase/5'-nucleotidase [Paenibacillus sp. MBLB4367]|uniref:bifunctional metallophosphatase/5'-nucleotidase n=1 Tax=Paenibacillus sp. MBLB4367 TaxID=3384767 RepID=UPI0039083190